MIIFSISYAKCASRLRFCVLLLFLWQRYSCETKVKRPVSMATVIIKLLNGEYKDEGGMVADLRLMVENCRRCVGWRAGGPACWLTF